MLCSHQFLRIPSINTPIARIGIGCEQLGGYEWGSLSESEVCGAIRLAIEQGLNFLDTADVYGLGRSEELLGEIIRPVRDKIVLSTKFGVRQGEGKKIFYDVSRKWMHQAVDASLKRLKTEWIDLYQVHYWDEATPLEELFESLESLRASGKIRVYGISNIDPRRITAKPEGLSSFSLEYSIIERKWQAAIEYGTNELDLVFIPYGCLAQGLLSGKYNEHTVFPDNDRRRRHEYKHFHGKNLQHNLAIIGKLNKLLPIYNCISLAQLSVAWVLHSIETSIALTGIKNSSQVLKNRASLDLELTAKDIKYIKDLNDLEL